MKFKYDLMRLLFCITGHRIFHNFNCSNQEQVLDIDVCFDKDLVEFVH